MCLADENDTLGSELSNHAVHRESGVQIERLEGYGVLRGGADSRRDTCQREDNQEPGTARPHGTVILTRGTIPDGEHIVALTPAEGSQAPHDRVEFVLNFFDELRRRVPLNAN
jgi:hypothetical protein